MAKFSTGMLPGIALGLTAEAWAAGVYGSRTLLGWTVTKDGEEVCSDPLVNIAGKRNRMRLDFCLLFNEEFLLQPNFLGCSDQTDQQRRSASLQRPYGRG
jgi:hypothetical protein